MPFGKNRRQIGFVFALLGFVLGLYWVCFATIQKGKNVISFCAINAYVKMDNW
jgi:hypothetical protein